MSCHDPRDILARVAALPVTQWSYRNEPGVRRIGPVAQDFHAAFGLGNSDKTIATGDESGVALAAIQGLHQLMQEKDAKIDAQARELQQLQDRLSRIEALLFSRQALRDNATESGTTVSARSRRWP